MHFTSRGGTFRVEEEVLFASRGGTLHIEEGVLHFERGRANIIACDFACTFNIANGVWLKVSLSWQSNE